MDAVDLVLEAWQRERPDLDFWPVGVVGRVQRLSRLLDQEIKTFAARHGLDQGEVDVLMTLRRAGEPFELSAGALLKTSMVTSGAITARIDRMEAKSLVERVRDGNDRRSVRVRLTEHGNEVVDTLVGEHLANEERLLRGLDRGELDQLARSLRTLLESLGDRGVRL
ncbi:DNA-binding transcriptional regulator, MarR family [Amycolatopsis xylanica]|uniref:DNA-binding transcriptional regulator, MarR family n=1 Tax=Amycolatopsis xylanica TaxID=589385 RepID=A0A1H2WFR0_9PSEU|nr:DNA-binding transcriptional regulator, MarR family [Amycolatopsis xylanica]